MLKKQILSIILPVLISLSLSVLVFIKIVTPPAGESGDICWDKNRNWQCDIKTEDINGDHKCTIIDCKGYPGIDGINGINGDICWDRNGDGECDLLTEDFNNDSQCNVDDCYLVLNGTRCFDDITPTYFNISDCKGEDLVLNRTALPFCWDLNSNGIQDLPDEDTNNDTFVDTRDCNGHIGQKCWDDNADGICQLSEAGDNSTCEIEDCVGPQGYFGDACWDLNKNKICNPISEDINGDGNCTADDCFGFRCWDLNQNRVCNLLTEDLNDDGNCTYLDCEVDLLYNATHLATPNTTVRRYGIDEGLTSIYVTDLTARIVNFIFLFGAVQNLTALGGTIYVDNVYDYGDYAVDGTTLYLTSQNGSVKVNDDLKILLTLYLADGHISTVNGTDLVITASNIFTQTNTSISTIHPVNGTLTINPGARVLVFNETLYVNNITSSTNLTLTSNTVKIKANTFLQSGKKLITNFIAANPETNYVRLNVNGMTTIPVDTYYVDTNYITATTISSYKYVEGAPLTDLYIWADSVGILGFPVGTGLISVTGDVFPFSGSGPVIAQTATILVTDTIYANDSDLTLVTNSSGYTNIIPPDILCVDHFESRSGELTLTNVTIVDRTKVDTIVESTSGSSTTLSNGILLSNSVSSYTPYKLDFYEVSTQGYGFSGIYALTIPGPIKVVRLGPGVSITLLVEVRFTSVTSNQIFVDPPLAARFRPSIDYLFTDIPVYNNGQLAYDGILELFTNGTMVFSATYTTGSRFFTAGLHQNGVSVFTVDYLI
jgi:hypothetical protein